MSSLPKIHRPTPRRLFSHEPSPQNSPASLLSPELPDESPSRTHSILNLTSSTLLGIFTPSGYEHDADTSTPSTPRGLGVETPRKALSPYQIHLRRKSNTAPSKRKAQVLALGLRSLLLFGTGMGYGLLVRHLDDDRQLTPFQLGGLLKPRNDWRYLLFWGVAGIALGSLLPWVDTFYSADSDAVRGQERRSSPVITDERRTNGRAAWAWEQDWTPVIRSIGAFVGIAYGIRKLPWTSALQASLTLALVNPVLWYLIDRSKPGFLLSLVVGATGTTLLLVSDSDMMPSPASLSQHRTSNATAVQNGVGVENAVLSWLKRDSTESAIWTLSVLFCSCVCFGNIGRRLALNRGLNTDQGDDQARR